MTKVLVTGAGGFIGRHLPRRLAELNHEVVCLHSMRSASDDQVNEWGQEVVRADVRDAAASRNPPCFVQISSLAVAGAAHTPAREAERCNPVSHYGRTKLEAEVVLEQYADRSPSSSSSSSCLSNTSVIK